MTRPDDAHCRAAFGRFVTGVVIVTAMTPDGPAGFTVQTFGSLSVDPPAAFFAALITSTSWGRVREVGVVGFNVLRSDQEPLARVFATSGADKFASGTWTNAPKGSPLLVGALVHLEGTIRVVANQGDHDIVVVDLDHAATFPGEPLAYYASAFRELA